MKTVLYPITQSFKNQITIYALQRRRSRASIKNIRKMTYMNMIISVIVQEKHALAGQTKAR